MAVVIMLKFTSSNKNALTKSALSLNFCLFAILKPEPIQFTTGRAWPTWAPTGRLDNSGRSGNDLMLNIVKLKQGMFKRHSSSYWTNVGVGDI